MNHVKTASAELDDPSSLTASMASMTPVEAGDFGAWVAAMTHTLRGDTGSDVPCGDCVGCCSSHWPIALRPADEAVANQVPRQWLVEDVHSSSGLRYMTYRPDGTCPLLKAGRCSVYAVRPQTCRDFDCRLFAATGVESAGPDKPLIDARIAAWRFTYRRAEDEAVHDAMRKTARFLRHMARERQDARLPTSPIAIAGIAFKAHAVFLDSRDASFTEEELLRAVIQTARDFDEITRATQASSES